MEATIESVFLKVWYWRLLRLSVHQLQIWLKSDNNVGQFASRFQFLYIVCNRNNVYHKKNDKEIHSCLFLAKLKYFNSSLFSDVTQRIVLAGLPMFRDEFSLPSSSPLRLDQYVFTQTSVIDCQSSLQNTAEERIFHSRRGRNLEVVRLLYIIDSYISFNKQTCRRRRCVTMETAVQWWRHIVTFCILL